MASISERGGIRNTPTFGTKKPVTPSYLWLASTLLTPDLRSEPRQVVYIRMQLEKCCLHAESGLPVGLCKLCWHNFENKR